jgi:AraC family transcriptional regulator of adaptative response / DNA-3-methyladenine glycosylase II
MPRSRGRALTAMASALAGGLDPRDRDAFLALGGIGPWTAGYVAMRCGDRDVLLETDLGVRRGFARLADPAALVRRAEAWRPWRSYAVQHLWSLA